MKRKLTLVNDMSAAPVKSVSKGLLADVREMILEARQTVARGVNAALVVLYWNIGQRIRRDILKEKRAEYGQEILQSLAAKLASEFGRGYSARNLASMVRFVEVFPDRPMLAYALDREKSASA